MTYPPLKMALLALALLPGATRAQGGLLSWERVGDRPVKLLALAFDGAGTLYGGDSFRAYRLDLDVGFPGAWVLTSEEAGGDAMIGLGPDTLLTTWDARTKRSTDGGQTWATVHDSGDSAPFALHEAPEGTPLAGTLFVGGVFAASEDRGATWEARGQLPDLGAHPIAFVTLPSSSPHPGRLVASAFWGAAYSDDGGWTWELSSLWGFNRFATYAIALVEGPGGTERLITVGVDAAAPHVRAWHSDDGGETWAPEAGFPLPEPPDGVGYGRTSGVWALGGARAVAVLGRGSVYGTGDGGATWSEVGQLPDIDEDTYAYTSTLGPDGRLYVALIRIGSQLGNSWVYRTQQRVVTVAAEPEPEPPGEGLTVQPNPATSSVQIGFRLSRPAAVEVRVYDALGREVAVLADGRYSAGRHEAVLEGAALPSGSYLVRAVVTSEGGSTARVLTRRLILIRRR